uniref:Uncharacterized protein LOC110215282 isoform X5 n=1 Tax=Phascolarctos cinereus TaxID=38626 RepID=A0A6P5L9N4_PHACI|nr:uncharacterized protein LOC110215282 isoform X5 [Phascolarctos cinereus]
MEVLDEFDWEHPLTFTFCELISEEAFERQAVSYTERSLRRLFRSMDRNPALGERVVRKWKQEERERHGLISFLTVGSVGGSGGPSFPSSHHKPRPLPPRTGSRGPGVRPSISPGPAPSLVSQLIPSLSSTLSQGRFFQALQGDLNHYNNVGASELQQRLDHLKKKMQKLNNYAQGLQPWVRPSILRVQLRQWGTPLSSAHLCCSSSGQCRGLRRIQTVTMRARVWILPAAPHNDTPLSL